ncbi:MAG: ABC transporter permease, partial [Caulobacteraceae bacterium]
GQALAARLAGGGQGLTPVLPLAWIDLLAVLPAPVLAALTAAIAARLAAAAILKQLG